MPTHSESLFQIDLGARFGSNPLVEGSLAFDDEDAGGHGGMRIATQLRAIDLVAAFFGGLEPNGSAHAGNRILSDSHGNYFEGVNDIFCQRTATEKADSN